ncbi:MAG: transposase [Nanoarchaeota archaeon]
MKRKTTFTYGVKPTYFLTTTVTNFTHIFKEESLAQLVINNINFYRKKFEVKIHGYVIMPNHIHLMLTMSDKGNVSQFMGQMK